MRKLLMTGLLALGLSGCDDEEQRRAYRAEDMAINAQLPVGCQVKDLGRYRNLTELVIVDCGERSSVTMGEGWSAGKAGSRSASIVILGAR